MSAARATVSSARSYIADAEFDRIEIRMHPQIPPDLFTIVYAVGLDQQRHEIVKVTCVVEHVG